IIGAVIPIDGPGGDGVGAGVGRRVVDGDRSAFVGGTVAGDGDGGRDVVDGDVGGVVGITAVFVGNPAADGVGAVIGESVGFIVGRTIGNFIRVGEITVVVPVKAVMKTRAGIGARGVGRTAQGDGDRAGFIDWAIIGERGGGVGIVDGDRPRDGV